MIQRMVSFNVNSIRARLHQLKALVEKHQPSVIGLQETKVEDAQFPIEDVEALGYHAIFHGQKGHYGVAILSKIKPLNVQKGFAHHTAEDQTRFIACAVPLDNNNHCWVVNGYFPQGESRDHPTKFPMKEKFYRDLSAYVKEALQQSAHVLVMGDANVAAEDLDVGIGAQNAKRWLQTGKCSFLPEERAWMQTLKAQGLTDTFRHLHPTATDLSWFDYRSQGFDDQPKRGLRIDVMLASQPLLGRCVAAGMDYEIRAMEKPSDHCPVWVDIAPLSMPS